MAELGLAVAAIPFASMACATTVPPAVRCGQLTWASTELAPPRPTTIAELRALRPIDAAASVEGGVPSRALVFLLRDVALSSYRSTADEGADLVLADAAGQTLRARIDGPTCIQRAGHARAALSQARAAFQEAFPPTDAFLETVTTVSLTAGADFATHFESAAGPDGAVRLDPVVSICFGVGCSLRSPNAR